VPQAFIGMLLGKKLGKHLMQMSEVSAHTARGEVQRAQSCSRSERAHESRAQTF
jgi:hypothetical protein